MDSFQYEGVFWLPEEPEQMVAGRLTFDPDDGVQLSLIGHFGDLASSFSSTHVIRREIILGVAGRKQLTLIDGQHLGFNFEAPGIQRERYRADAVLAGHHFSRIDQIVFDEVHVSLGSIEQWVGKTAIGVSLTFDSQEQLVETEATLRPLAPEVSIGEEDDIALHFDYSFGGDRLSEYRLRNGCQLRISTSSSRPLEEIVEDAGLLQHLLTLCAGKAVPLEEITLTSEDVEYEVQGKYRRKPIAYFAALPSSWVVADKPVQNYEMLSTYEQMGGINAVHSWLATARRFGRVLSSLLSIRYARQIYAENRLQNSIGAAETFHRMRFDNFVVPPEEYKAFRKSLVKAVPAEHHNWLSQQLQYSNEPRLKQRLGQLAAFAGEPFAALVAQDVDSWADVVSRVRNRLTHYDEHADTEFNGAHLYFLSESLLLLLMLCLFVECGVSPQVLGKILENQRVMFTRRQLAEIVPQLKAELAH